MGLKGHISCGLVKQLPTLIEKGGYQVPPALSLRSNTLIFWKYFSASNAAAVIAPIICQSISRVGKTYSIPAAPAPIMATDLTRCSLAIIRVGPFQFHNFFIQV